MFKLPNLSLFFFIFLVFVSQIRTDQQFSKKVVLVTGGTTGIGFEIAKTFAQNGAYVTITGRDKWIKYYNGTHAVFNINQDPLVIMSGGHARFIKNNVIDNDSVKSLIDDIVKTYGTLDIAINNAGILGYQGKIHTIPESIPFSEEHDPILTNLIGTYNCMYHEVKYWKDSNKTGIIVNVSARDGLSGTQGLSMYSASKYGIIGLTKSVAAEFLVGPPDIRVNAIAPGAVDTFLLRNQANYAINNQQYWEADFLLDTSTLWQEYKKNVTESLASHEIQKTNDIVESVLFLSSKEASFVSGMVWSIDDGQDAI
ncbi:xanthoxin dehydrogenase [Anaeramoeba flamelloides]|uniref:Xanthoxin dehydrogenase n=2 Tax=Anaeramoeba flamelloides TaxID=1746091 RepID=A0AAV7ZJ66_9EUKA|nr:xanthoxin dehydrogenase [Anaeramoeba flamelloides]|eukprot:Anaeramoba_flamelloidesc27910_g1_i1.p1 GENE.c27910_g1_i1~~c27910_g1_i1.p1  ORF type:complete len:319 (-),score=51.39 c27910_g1_i1:106-1041(-)